VRDHVHTPSDLLFPTRWIECEPCGRPGRSNVARLIEQYSDAGSSNILADCPKTGSKSIYDPCRVRLEKTAARARPGPRENDLRRSGAEPRAVRLDDFPAQGVAARSASRFFNHLCMLTATSR
jgi:hypothetical protein